MSLTTLTHRPTISTQDAPSVTEPVDAEALFKEAKQRERKRRITIGAVCAVVFAAGLGIVIGIGGIGNDPSKLAKANAGPVPLSPTNAASIRSERIIVFQNTITSKGTVANATGQVFALTMGSQPVRRITQEFRFGGSLPNSNTPAIYQKGFAQAQTDTVLLTVKGRLTQYTRLPTRYSVVCAPNCVRTTRGWYAVPALTSQDPPKSGYLLPAERWNAITILQTLRTVADGNLVKIGSAVVAGTPTAEYQETIDPTKWTNTIGRRLSALFYDRIGSYSLPQYHEIDLWIDHEGLLRKVQTSQSGIAHGYSPDQPNVPVETVPETRINSWTFSTFNQPVRPVAPAASNVLVMRGPMKSLCGGWTTNSCKR